MKTISLQARLQRVQMIIALVGVVTVMVLSTLLFLSSTIHMHMLSAYQDLQEYYYSINESTDAVKNVLINEIGDDLGTYARSLERAREAVGRLQDNPDLEERWRFVLLSNMLDSYNECAKVLEKQYKTNPDLKRYQYYYEDFLHKDELIQETSTTYYHLLTASMNHLQLFYSTLRRVCIGVCLVVLASILFWSLYLKRFFVQDLSRPLEAILTNIAKIQKGQYNVLHGENRMEELHKIDCALTDMARQISRVIEVEKENASLEKKLAQSELRMLQNQINPHFLFNTLNMIYCLCEEGRSAQAADMIFKTSHLLRYSLEMQNRVSTFRQEVGAIKDYIEIQQARKSGRIEFVLDVDPDPILQAMPIPAMVFQPLVENAILHGLKNCLENGRIVLSIRHIDQVIHISVCDNGIGIPADKLARIEATREAGEGGLGLFNVLHRMEMFYGRRMKYTLQSKEGQGTEVSFMIARPGGEV